MVIQFVIHQIINKFFALILSGKEKKKGGFAIFFKVRIMIFVRINDICYKTFLFPLNLHHIIEIFRHMVETQIRKMSQIYERFLSDMVSNSMYRGVSMGLWNILRLIFVKMSFTG